jgi:UDP-N-acetylmuramoyl-tripeptide--D-alanyl-D-alanine ligase
VIKRTLQEIQQMASGFGLQEPFLQHMITGVSIDSRTVGAGNLFIPIKGEKFNGHQFVKDAFDKGAVASFWQEDEPNPPSDVPLIFVKDTLEALQTLARNYRQQLDVKVVGITGSNGKTTTKDLVAAVLSTAYRVHKTEGNLNNHIGLPLTILRMKEDTEIAVLEMGMSARGEIERLSEIANPDIAVITNIGEAHLQDLGSREAIAEAKFEIVSGLKENGVFIYNGDEPLLNNLVKNASKKLLPLTFGQNESSDYYPFDIRQEDEKTIFKINKAPDFEFSIPVLGKHNVYNALAAIAVGFSLNIEWEKIQNGLHQAALTNMRTEMIKTKEGFTVINDAYNASPTSMKAAIQLLNDLKGYKRKIVVLGDMLELGEREIEFHQEIGRYLDPENIQFVFTYGRLGAEIAKAAKETYAPDRVKAFEDKSELINELKPLLTPEDIVLVKASRGMKLEEVVAGLQQK